MMNERELQEFQQLFRKVIERCSLADVDILLRHAVISTNDPLLVSPSERPPADVHISRWPSINAAMKNARDGLVNGRMGAMILSLVHRNSCDLDMTVEVTFAKSAVEAPFGEKTFAVFNRDAADYDERLNKARALTRLPDHPHYGPARINPTPKLVGLEFVSSIYDRDYEPGEGWKDRADAISTTKKLASDLVFLRFCQTAEQQLGDIEAPRLPTFLTVKMEAWPMETGTIDYCDPAVRIVPA